MFQAEKGLSDKAVAKPVSELENLVTLNGKDLPARMGLRPLARELGIAHTTLLAQEKNGAFERGPDKKFDVAEVITYRSITSLGSELPDIPEGAEEAEHNLAKSKAKKEHWLAERARIHTEKAAGKLLEREVVEATLEVIGSELVTAMMNLKPKLRPYMTEKGRAVLDKSIDSTLRDMGAKLTALAEADHADEAQLQT